MVFGPALTLALSTASRKLQSPAEPLHWLFGAPGLRLRSLVVFTVRATPNGTNGVAAAETFPAVRTITSRSPFTFRGIPKAAIGTLSTLKDTGIIEAEVVASALGVRSE